MRRYNKGWMQESERHSLARRGVKTGRKQKCFVGKILTAHGDEKGYQGWSNHATWAVKLNWDNNEGDYRYFTEQAREYLENDKPVHEFADFLKEAYEQMFDDVVEGNATEAAKNMVRDVGNGHDVDWHEIAEAYYSEEKENQAYETKHKKSGLAAKGKHLVACFASQKTFKTVPYNKVEPHSDGLAYYEGKMYGTKEDLKYFPKQVRLVELNE